MKIYIASSEDHSGKIQEDIYIRDMYISKGIPSEIITLKRIIDVSRPSDVVILKSIWGYHINHEEFTSQILTLKNKGVRLVNNYDFIFWNINKDKYLSDIEYMNVIPTSLLCMENNANTQDIVRLISEAGKRFNADKLVIKPSISASGYMTKLYDVNTDNTDIITSLELNKGLDFIVQPYRPSISEGEISVIIIRGKTLYGVTRFPGVLSEKKGTTYLDISNIPTLIKKELLVLEDFFLKKFGSLPDICRVDFLKNHSKYEISEVELIDPDLFFRHIPEDVKKEALSLFYDLVSN